MIETGLAKLQKLQGICIRLNFNSKTNTSNFIDQFKQIAAIIPQLYLEKGFGEISHQMSVEFIKDVAQGIALLNREDTFEDGKKIISQKIVSLIKELTS